MEIGEEITIKVRIVDFDSNPRGSAIKVEIPAFVDKDERLKLQSDRYASTPNKKLRVWIHRLDQPEVIVKK